MDKLFLISHYEKDFRWVRDYTDYYLVYNKNPKSPYSDLSHIMQVKNVGVNIHTLMHYIYYNYEFLPDLIVTLQDNPFDHCRREKFNELIQRNKFTPIEEYYHNPSNSYEQRDYDGGFLEINNNWVIDAHNKSYGLTCKYSSLDQFMHKYFSNYQHIDWIRFAPGAMYIIEKSQILHYPKKLWLSLMNEFDKPNMTEAHIVERCLWMIFSCTLKIREEILEN